MLMGDGTVGQADGTSFCFGSDVADASFGEGGSGTGLIVRFNTYAGAFRGYILYWKGAELARVGYSPPEVFGHPAQWADVEIELNPAGQVSVKHAGNVIFDEYQLPNFTPITGNAKFGFGARTGGENQVCYIDDLSINDWTLGPVSGTVTPAVASLPEAFQATFTATAMGSPWHYYGQWYRNGEIIPGASGRTYTTPPITLANNGDSYTCLVSNDFSSVTTSAGVIAVLPDLVLMGCSTKGDPDHLYVQWNKAVQGVGLYDLPGLSISAVEVLPADPTVTLLTVAIPPDASYTLSVQLEQGEDGGAQVPESTTCGFSQPLGRFCADFNDNAVPAGTTVAALGAATPPYVSEGVLHLTDKANDLNNRWTIPLAAAQTFPNFKAQWRTFLGSSGGADGWSFNVGVGPFSYASAEEGATVGLSVMVDTYNNGLGDTGVEVKWNGSRLGFVSVPTCENCGAPAALNNDQWVDTSVEVTPDGAVTFRHGVFTVTGQIPNFTGIAANQYEFAARTGGANENFWLDDVCIQDYTLGPIAVEIAPAAPNVLVGEVLTLVGNVSGSPWQTYAWSKDGVPIPGANSRYLTLPAATEADTGTVYALAAENEISAGVGMATLTVRGNPIVVHITTQGTSDRIYVTFNKPVNLDGIYTVDGGAVAYVSQDYGATENIVVVTTAPFSPNVQHSLEILAVTAKPGGEEIDVNPTTVTFVTALSPFPWSVGLDDNGWPCTVATPCTGGGTNANFVQEGAGISPIPGSPTSPIADQGNDNDYYFSGDYSTTLPGVVTRYGAYTPVGLVAANELGIERAFAGADLDTRIHFNLPSSLTPDDMLTVTWDALNLDDTPTVENRRFGVEVYFNGVLVQPQVLIRPPQLGVTYATAPFTLASVGAQTGAGFDNVVTLRGISYNAEGGGNWMGIDYIKLDAVAGQITGATISAGQVNVTWVGTGALESAPSIDGPWTPVTPMPTSPYAEAVVPGENRFFRLKK
jgi:hypothetical protein